jgi:hypothetical protein
LPERNRRARSRHAAMIVSAVAAKRTSTVANVFSHCSAST